MPIYTRHICPESGRHSVIRSSIVPPAAQIEIAHTKIGALGDDKRVTQSGQQGLIYVVKDAWHLILIIWDSEDYTHNHRVASPE